MARPVKCRCICSLPQYTRFDPQGRPDGDVEEIVLGVDEFEVIRLLDYLHMTQEECAQRMNIARTTVTRMYDLARGKVAEALATGKRLRIQGGEYALCERRRPECAGGRHCCHCAQE